MSSSRTDAATLVEVRMPQMGVSVAEGTVVAWRVEVGDRIQTEETICEISTDKIDTEVPAPASGVVTEILVGVESTVAVGTILARIALDAGATPGGDAGAIPGSDAGAIPGSDAGAIPGSDAGAIPGGEGDGGSPPGPSPAANAAGANGGVSGTVPPPGTVPAVRGTPDPRRYSPVVTRIAAEHGVDLSRVSGTGRDGRVRKQDVLAWLGSPESGVIFPRAEPEPALHTESPYRAEPPAPAPAQTGDGLSRMRRQIGEHMKRSLHTAATCTTWIEIDMGGVEAARTRLRVTALPFVARAVVGALREHPSLNAWLEEDRYTRFDQAVHLGIAVSLGEDGLLVPVVHNAQELSIEGLSARIRDLAQRARAGTLTPDEVRGGTFTLTNPGQYGSIMATPIINQPQVAILDLEAIVKRPVVVTDARGNDAIAIRPMTILGCSWDHRALDGALAAQFLASVKRRLETFDRER